MIELFSPIVDDSLYLQASQARVENIEKVHLY